MNSITVKVIKQADPAAVVRLYQEAGWWRNDYTDDFIPPVLRNSFCVVGAFDGNELIGMGRAISDGVSDAYIQDIAVLNAYRGRGIGTRIVKKLLRHLQQHHVDWIGLIGEPGTEPFYGRLGFAAMPHYVPMLLQQPPAGRRRRTQVKERS